MREVKTIENEMGLPVTLQEIRIALRTEIGTLRYKNIGLVFDRVTDHADSEGSICLELNREQALKLGRYLVEYSESTLAGKK